MKTDPEGTTDLSIFDYFIIHALVQILCIVNYPQLNLKMEVSVTSKMQIKKGGMSVKGRLDLYSESTNMFYEIKSVGCAYSVATIMQMEMYRNSTINYNGKTPQVDYVGTSSLSGQFKYKNYLVSYSNSPECGSLIVYKVIPLQKKEELPAYSYSSYKEYATTGALLICCGGGASLYQKRPQLVCFDPYGLCAY